MIHIPCEQGSPEWIMARIGIPSASRFDCLLTPKTMKPSGSAATYLHELLAEWALGCSLDDGAWASGYVERGIDLEDTAVSWYELMQDVTTEPMGFCLDDGRRYGASPDRGVGSDGLLEVKVPAAKVHIGYMLGDSYWPYRCQVQGQLLVTGRRWVDLLCYHPTLPPVLTRHEPEPEFQEALRDVLAGFCAQIEAGKKRLLKMGIVPELHEAEPIALPVKE